MYQLCENFSMEVHKLKENYTHLILSFILTHFKGNGLNLLDSQWTMEIA